MGRGPLSPSLAVLDGLSSTLDEALVAPFPRGAARLGEGLLVGVLFGVDLVVEELLCQFIAIVDLQLRRSAFSTNVRKRWCRFSSRFFLFIPPLPFWQFPNGSLSPPPPGVDFCSWNRASAL